MTLKHVYKKLLYFYDSVILSKFNNKWVLWSKRFCFNITLSN